MQIDPRDACMPPVPPDWCAYEKGCESIGDGGNPETSRRVKALWSLLIGIIFASEVAWILFLVYLPIALVR